MINSKIRKCNTDFNNSSSNSKNNNNSKHGTSQDWSLVPTDILTTISFRLTIADYSAISNVCTSWRSSRGPLSSQMPFVLCTHDSSDSCTLHNLPDKLNYNVKLPPLHGESCVGSQDGWLILLDKTLGVFTLYNPFTEKELKLPSYAPSKIRYNYGTTFREKNLRYYDILDSCSFKKVAMNMMSAPNSALPNPAVVAIFREKHNLMYKWAGERSWKVEKFYFTFEEVYCWRGQFVGVQKDGTVYKLDIDGPDCKFECLARGSHDQFLFSPRCLKYLVELDGSLLQVWRELDSETQRTGKVVVRKLDPKWHSWEPIDDLRGHSLFLGASHSFCLPSRQFVGMEENWIYFATDWCLLNNFDTWKERGTKWSKDVGAFDTSIGRYRNFHLRDIKLPPGHSSMWFAPSPSELKMHTLEKMLYCN